LNRDNWLVETTSSGKLFHTLIIRTANKCFLQLIRASGTNKVNIPKGFLRGSQHIRY